MNDGTGKVVQPGTSDLFAIIDIVDEHSLGQRLLQQGADLYCIGNFASFKDRLRHVIVREQFQAIVSGTDPKGKVETYSQAFERVCGEPLMDKSKRTKSVPRGGQHETHASGAPGVSSVDQPSHTAAPSRASRTKARR